MLFIALKIIHLFCIVVWVGGMFFAHFFLRPAVQELDPPVRVKLMRDVLGKFFSVVLILAVLTLLSGIGMIGSVHGMAAKAGAQFSMPLSWIVMTVLGLIMMAVFGHIRFALYKRLNNAVEARDWAAGGAALASIRKLVALNLALGLVIIAAVRLPLGLM
ncbi:CopD family protein [Diaphorobacter aerolatus]|uniref:CopD family protein n=1 Tax=Diaphorobacter aerolatus TaxID=1288495 RepID=A0A7H0GJN6_9BURK|nr:CopD family protein [Diaphorobacter aerolatus]QNP48502.1 CopD family protein [Diaphorobacter aerolatus]